MISLPTNLVGEPSILQLGPFPCSPTLLHSLFRPPISCLVSLSMAVITRQFLDYRDLCASIAFLNLASHFPCPWFESSHLLYLLMNLKQGGTGRENMGPLILRAVVLLCVRFISRFTIQDVSLPKQSIQLMSLDLKLAINLSRLRFIAMSPFAEYYLIIHAQKPELESNLAEVLLSSIQMTIVYALSL
ncbi:hypothetical protein DKX38_013626 [Salix brachista]|uniref:Uncharacterized protein n=1 Tax=Salix brachista TaxID=2182728 RepID=A0A5N5LDN0_9ROSI|nr:hypothetical protein DKX38_013626 [Salix brachista]